MPTDGPLTSARRDALLAVLAVALLLAPAWVPALHLADERYRYESVAVETDGAELGFATEPDDLFVGLSERVACAGARVGRACVFERHVASNHTVPTSIYASQVRDFRDHVLERRYDYAYLDGTVYEVGAVTNTSARAPAGYRLDLGLRPVAATRALDAVSVDIEDAPPPVRRAARTGSATGYVEDVPATTVQLDDDTYRRVYVANASYPPEHERDTAALLRWDLPAVGLGLLARSWRRFDVAVSVRHRG